jgi:NCS1 family nucleobase:cation symporter-1
MRRQASPASEVGEDHSLDFSPVPPEKLQPASRFAGNYAGEHVAGTEFVIGALFVGAGAAASDVIFGLIIGNALAVLTWVLLTAPIAVETRLSLYAYLEKIARPGFLKIYSVVNGVMFLGLAGSMITVSASAVRIFYNSFAVDDISAQTGLLPSDIRFVLVALAVGVVVVTLAVMGFKRLAQFAAAVVPWMICMFLVGALALYPRLALTAGLSLPALSLEDVWTVLTTQVYQARPIEGPFWAIPNEGKSVWSIAAFAWVVNLAMHGSLGDMTLLRFAKHKSYGWFSALGMFIGHFAAWVFAGVMGAGAALILNSSISELDAGDVATQALGACGVVAVIIAGWTTSNPTLYRAGLAFQSLSPDWDRRKVTAIVGIVTMIVACSPFVFTKLLGYVGWMGLSLSPVGAIIVAEHWLLPRLGLTRYWSSYKGEQLNEAAVIAWASAFAVIFLFYFVVGVHQFFLLIPAWITATLVYIWLARRSGADASHTQAEKEEAAITARRSAEKAYLQSAAKVDVAGGYTVLWWSLQFVGWAALVIAVVMAVGLVTADAQEYEVLFRSFKTAVIWPTLVYFLVAIVSVVIPGEGRKVTSC